MATFHRMKDEAGRDVIRAFVKGAPDQLLARATKRSRPDGQRRPAADVGRPRSSPRTSGSARHGPARHGRRAQRDFDPATFDPDADLLPLMHDLTLLALVGIVDPPRPEARTRSPRRTPPASRSA